MNIRYDRYLVKKYAPLYQNRNADMRTTAMCWGFECGDGWFNLINTLSAHLCREWVDAKEDYDAIKDRAGMRKCDGNEDRAWNTIVTKEDIATAKVKMDNEAEKVPVAIQVKEKFGGLRFYVGRTTNEQDAIIYFAESMSYKTCDVCGNKGKSSRDGWITTRCKEHRDEF